MYTYAIHNGSIVKTDALYLHVSDLGLQRGYGVFDYFTMIEERIPWADDYLQRFYRSMELGGLSIPYSPAEILQMVRLLLKKNKAPNSGFKLICTGGGSDDGYHSRQECNFFILHMPLFMQRTPTTDVGQPLIAAQYLRPLPEIKSLFYFHSVLMQNKLKQFKAIDILYHYEDIVYEASRSNIFIVQDNCIYTKENNVLQGITRKQVIEIARKGYSFAYKNFSLEELLQADEVFITSSAKGVMPIAQIENVRIADGKPGEISLSLKKDLYRSYSISDDGR